MLKNLKLLFVLAAVLALATAAACTSEVVKEVEVPGETIIVEKEVIKEVEVPGETIVVEKEVIKEVRVEVPGETIVVEKEVIKEVRVEVPGETVIVEKEVIKEVEVPGETIVVTKEVIKEVPVEKIVTVEKEVVKIVEVEVPVIVEKEVRVVSEVERGEKVGRIAVCCMTDSFRMHLTGSGSVDMLYNLIGVHLVKGDPIQRKIVADLAERWEISPDFTSATYYLRKGAKWNDGEPITADDVVFTYRLWLDPTSIFAGQWYGLKGGETLSNDYDNYETGPFPGVVAVDDHTVKFTFETPNRTLIQTIHGGSTRFSIVPEHKLRGLSPEAVRATSYWKDDLTQGGPFKVARHVVQQFIELVPNEDYWFGRPILDKLQIIYINDADAREVAAHRGEVDSLFRGGLSSADSYKGLLLNPDWKVAGIPLGDRYGYQFSKNVDAALKDNRFRQAFAFALDREALLEGILEGRGTAMPSTIVQNPYARPEWMDMYKYDPEKSKMLLADMNWDSDRVVEVVVTNPNQTTQALMPIEQNMLAAAGIKIKWVVMERATHEDAMKKFDYEMQRGFQVLPGAGSGNPSRNLKSEYHTDGRDQSGFAADHNPTDDWDAKVDAIVAAVEDDEIRDLFWELGDVLMRDLPEITVMVGSRYYVVSNRLRLPGFVAMGLYESTATRLGDVPMYIPYWRAADRQFWAPHLWDIVD